MRRTEALQGVRVAMFLNIRRRWESAELNEEEAAELLGVSERTFRRWRNRHDEQGEAGLLDQRLGKASGRRVPTDRAEEVEALYRERYQGFTVRHFHEHLVKDHGFGWGYTWTKLQLQWKGLVAKAPRKGAHRRRRERRPLPGMMLHQDRPIPRAPMGAVSIQLGQEGNHSRLLVFSKHMPQREGGSGGVRDQFAATERRFGPRLTGRTQSPPAFILSHDWPGGVA